MFKLIVFIAEFWIKGDLLCLKSVILFVFFTENIFSLYNTKIIIKYLIEATMQLLVFF